MSSNAIPNKHNKQSLHFIARSGLAGGIAGCVAKTVVAPLDRVKILFQASNPDFQKYAGTWSGAFRAAAQLYREGGALSLLQGHSATLLRIFPYAAIKFMAYDQLENLLMPTKEKQTNARRFISGAMAGMTSVFFTYPLELVRVRMAFYTRSVANGHPKPTFFAAAREILHEAPSPTSASPSLASAPSSAQATSTLFARYPILKFYRGFTVSLVGMLPYAGMSFLTWGALRARFVLPASKSDKDRRRVHPMTDLSIGAVAGTVSQTVSYPFEVIRRRMQVGGLTHPDRWLRWGETARVIWNAGGWRGFYVGLSIGYLKIVPMTAVSFTVWQWAKRVLEV